MKTTHEKSTAHITVKDLTMAYGNFVLMQNLFFSINRGDVFIIMGGSGCGKSTLLRHLIGLKSPAKGKLFSAQTRSYTEKTDFKDFEAFAAAHSKNIASMCRDIARVIREHVRER